MLKTRIKRRAVEAARAAARLVEIEASVIALADEDLLDLADIFSRMPQSALCAMASTEMSKRGLKL